MSSSCGFSGNADMYGAGIRVGFYLQWLGTILAGWLASDEVPSMRMSNALFISATFLALILNTAQGTLRPVEIYVVLLLTFGGYLYHVPLYIWKISTCFNARLDPSRYPKVGNGPVYSVLNFGLVFAVSLFQVWFWLGKSEVRISEPVWMWFWALNAALYLFLLLICLVVLLITTFKIISGKWLNEGEDQEPEDPCYERPRVVVVLEATHSIILVLVASAVITATELTIRWNGIRGVGSISSTGQMIPMIIGIGQVSRILYLSVFGNLDKGRRRRVRVGPTNVYAMSSFAMDYSLIKTSEE